MKKILLLPATLLLSACDSLPDWAGGGEAEEAKLEGTRIPVLVQGETIQPDASFATEAMQLPDTIANRNWTQESGNVEGSGGNLAFDGAAEEKASVSIGEGNDFESVLVAAPIVADGKVFAMDAHGFISAHEAGSLNQLWTSSAAVGKEEGDILGGGLAYDKGKIYVAGGNGQVAALDAGSGQELWKKAVNIPMRSAPKVSGGGVYVVTVDNQLIALDADSGDLRWNHRGISENAGFLTAVSPAVSGNAVIAPYSSGELVALNAATGDEHWTDNLVIARRTVAANIFSGIDANPAIRNGIVYAIGSGGLMAATEIATGRRVWEQPVTGHNMPWLAGNYVFIVTSENNLVCMNAADGRVKWVSSLLSDDEKEQSVSSRPQFSGPVMTNGRLMVVNSAGALLMMSAESGELLSRSDIADDVYTPPVIAGGTLYLVDKSATLYAVR